MSTTTCTAVVLAENPSERTEAMAVAGYAGATRTSYATDLRIFAAWFRQADVGLLTVRRSHLELFGGWMEEIGRTRSTVARRLSTLATFYRYCEQERRSIAARPSTCADRRSTTNPARLAWTATSSVPFSSRPGWARLETTPWPRCWR